jgi:hypothetical protein
MRWLGLATVVLTVAGCGIADHHPPTSSLDPPTVEFRNAEGVGRWCISPAFSETNHRSCRDSLLASGYREVGPYCAHQVEDGAFSGNVAAWAALGGIGGAISASRMNSAHAAHRAACQQRQAAS